MTQLVAEFHDGTYDEWYGIRVNDVLTYKMLRESCITHEWVLRNLLDPDEQLHKSQYRNDLFSWLEAKYQTRIVHIKLYTYTDQEDLRRAISILEEYGFVENCPSETRRTWTRNSIKCELTFADQTFRFYMYKEV